MYSLLRQKASALEPDLNQLACKLVATSSPSFSESRIAEYVISALDSLYYDRVFKDNAGNVVGCIFGRNYNPTLLLVSHLDTYSDNSKIKKCGLEDGRLYGAGASDCKGGLAAQMYAGRLLKECFPMYGNLILVSTVAQQSGCSAGIRQFLKETLPSIGLEPSFALLGEPTDLGLYYGHDGWMCIELILTSEDKARLEACVKELNLFLSKGSSSSSEDLLEEVSVGDPQYSSDKQGTRCVIGVMQRLRDKNEPVFLLRRYRETARLICKQFEVRLISCGIERRSISEENGCKLRARQLSVPWMTDPLNSFFEEARLALRAADCKIKGGTWQLKNLGMGTAGSVLVNEYSIPTIGYGPGNMSTSPEEYVEIRDLNEAFFGTAVIAHRLLGVPTSEKNEPNYKLQL
ncbi:MAG: M20 family metallopeptidase [Fibrobacter sp.]|jgi:acetylornithine deacetylase/succinyl-diaminopimelate desuccinylase-like protein|nr:M20 family metallopeptidase [Fibrobacter sp.]